MNDWRQRTAEILRGERTKLEAELAELNAMLDMLDPPAPIEPPPPAGLPRLHSRAQGEANQREIIELLGRNPSGLTPQMLMARSGISATGVKQNLWKLLDEGRVTRERGARPDGRKAGQKPFFYKLVPAVEEREHTLDLKSRLVVE